MKKLLKKLNAWLHLWLGLVSGIIVVIMGITGCVLVFEHEIRNATNPWRHAPNTGKVDMLPPSALAKSAAAAAGKPVTSIWYKGEDKAAVVSLEKSDSVAFVNPYTAQVNAIVEREDFFDWVLDGHIFLWLPHEVGHHITAYGTLLFFILLVTGIVLWWPKNLKKANVDKSFKIKWTASFKRVNYDLHNVLGFYSFIVATIFAFSALMMCFGWFSSSVYWTASGGESVPPRVSSHSDTSIIRTITSIDNVDKAWRKGINEIGVYNKKEIIVAFPDEPAEALYLCVDMHRGTWRDIYLDQHTLAQLPTSEKTLRELKFADLIMRANYGLHVGSLAGMTTQVIYFLGSLICASLPITGFLVWWGKKKKKKPVKKAVLNNVSAN
ncbi:putative iron-regulated membrane protein [Chitinophaga skermanii]|uniref:Putative iron-regulated membrane protein n=1 Tax=Chitinophaga skermanii TaxID=331697 RepID=A0A327R326_9BACT|nr:PepSY-associated TM helix domain-containing protein [Chitinophaga skermanii]RAJ08287.1 putative iron-regulated membrane protein [Chitinophaga skermanii]